MPRALLCALLGGALAAGCAAERLIEPPSARGYVERACGFDLDDDGRIGEPADDCNLCDGVTNDPDGDGVAEDLIYVDCADGAGVDVEGCGSPARPCASLAYAFGQVADGPADGAEDVVCFRGTCRPEELTPAVGGVSGHREVAARGSESRPWQLPTDPAMLVGWDHDDDGMYPPADPDDVAVLDGSGGLKRAFFLNRGVDNSYFEMAHFTVSGYGAHDGQANDGSAEAGFVKLNQTAARSHLYFHDLSLREINGGQPLESNRITFDLFHATGLRWVAVVNVEALDTGSFFARGDGGEGPAESGPFRWQNLTLTARGCDDSGPGACATGPAAFHGFKVWGYLSGMEILDSVFDAQVDSWKPRPSGGPAGAIAFNPGPCTRDWVIRNNDLRDFKVALGIQGGDQQFCSTTPRTVNAIVFDLNRVVSRYPWSFGFASVGLGDPGNAPRRGIEDVTVTGNLFVAEGGQYEGCLLYAAGNRTAPNPGTVVFVNNTCHGAIGRENYGAINLRDEAPHKHERWVIENNLFSRLGPGGLNAVIGYQPAGWRSDFNVFADGAWAWGGRPLASLDAWREASGGDAHSRRCDPSYLDPSSLDPSSLDPRAGDFHLRADDECARDHGTSRPELSRGDRDGDPRGADGGWDVGADEAKP